MKIINQKRNCHTIKLDDLFKKYEEEKEVFKCEYTFGEYYCLQKHYGWIIL